jgi:hypothetical protein
MVAWKIIVGTVTGNIAACSSLGFSPSLSSATKSPPTLYALFETSISLAIAIESTVRKVKKTPNTIYMTVLVLVLKFRGQ